MRRLLGSRSTRTLRLVLVLVPVLLAAALSSSSLADDETTGLDVGGRAGQPQPLLVPLRRATHAPSSTPGDDARGRLLRSNGNNKAQPSDPPPAPAVAPLTSRPEVQLGYSATLRLPGKQEVEVLPDTGSSLLWLPTTLCDECNQVIVDRAHPDLSSIMPLVDPVKAQAPLVNCSSAECVGQCSPELLSLLDIRDAETYCAPHGGVCTTFPLSDAVGIAGACAFNATYADGSTQVGALARGPVELGGVKLANMTWGALVFGQTPRLLQPRGGGILGLQPGSCRATELSCAPSFLDTMAAEKGLPKVMAFCGNKDRPLLVLGGDDGRLHQAPVLYTPILGRGDQYLVGIASAAVGDIPLPVAPDSGALVDTGSSLAFLPEPVLAAMAQALPEAQRALFDATWDAPLALNATDLAGLPTLTLTVPGGAVLALEGSDYLQPLGEADPATGLPLHYFALRPGRRPDFFLLGQVVLRKMYTEFDAEKGRVGFAPAVADCYKAAGL